MHDTPKEGIDAKSGCANGIICNNICSQNRLAQIGIKPPQGDSLVIDRVYIENNLIDGINIENGIEPVFGNPDFVNINAGNFHLLSTSPAIDKGTAVNAPNVDFDSVSRPIGDGYDIGAYKYPTTSSIINLSKEDDIFCYPNPFKDVLFIEGKSVLSVSILNSSGQLIQQMKVNKKITKINLSHLSKGVYFVKIVSAKGTSLKIIHK